MARKIVSRKRGAAVLELALLSPWIMFLFVGALDWGFYGYSLITLETATRSAAVYASSQTTVDAVGSCQIALNEMGSLINMSGVTSWHSSPLVCSATEITGLDGNNAAQVSVAYTTPAMIPIPGLLAKQFTVTRVVQMKMP